VGGEGGRDIIELEMYVLIFCKVLSENFLVVRKIKGDNIKNSFGILCKARVLLVIF
jgi:hypothetical protein